MKIYAVTNGENVDKAFLDKIVAHERAEEIGADQVTAYVLAAPTMNLIVNSAARATGKFPKPFEGGNHLMRYIQAAVKHADSQWKISEDGEIDGIRVNKEDAAQVIKIAGAIYRFIEQVGASNLARLADMSPITNEIVSQEDIDANVERNKREWYGPNLGEKFANVEFNNTQLAEPWVMEKARLDDQVLTPRNSHKRDEAADVRFFIPNIPRPNQYLEALLSTDPVNYERFKGFLGLTTTKDVPVGVTPETAVAIVRVLEAVLDWESKSSLALDINGQPFPRRDGTLTMFTAGILMSETQGFKLASKVTIAGDIAVHFKSIYEKAMEIETVSAPAMIRKAADESPTNTVNLFRNNVVDFLKMVSAEEKRFNCDVEESVGAEVLRIQAEQNQHHTVVVFSKAAVRDALRHFDWLYERNHSKQPS